MDMRSMPSKSVRLMWMKSIECCGCRSRFQRKAWTERGGIFCSRGTADSRQSTGALQVRLSCTSSEAISYNEVERHLTTRDTGRSMEDFQQKRRLIEQGELTSWERRGRGAFTVERVPFHRIVLKAICRVEWLRARGERNANEAVVRTLRFTFDSLPSAFCG